MKQEQQNTPQEVQLPPQQTFDLLISNYAVPQKKSRLPFFKGKKQEVIQGEPFEWGVIIKNISTTPTPEAKITSAMINFREKDFGITMDTDSVFVRSLNPNEEIKVLLNSCTCYVDGALTTDIEIIPNTPNSFFITYQYEKHHNKNMLYSDSFDKYNQWIDMFPVQNKMEVLQSKTNHYILLLTVVTAWESLFGIKETVKNILLLMKLTFLSAFEFLSWLVTLFG